MKNKKQARLIRARRSRKKMQELGATRLSVNRTARHIYAQIIAPEDGKIVAHASSLEAELRQENTGNVAMAERIGGLIAERGIAAGAKKVAFDRSGFKYHGRVKALADAARGGGLEF